MYCNFLQRIGLLCRPTGTMSILGFLALNHRSAQQLLLLTKYTFGQRAVLLKPVKPVKQVSFPYTSAALVELTAPR